MTDRILTTSRLAIDLEAVRENYRIVLAELSGVPAAAMVKANGYGLGSAEVTRAVAEVGCRSFYVASLSEGVELRQALPDVDIRVLNGAMPGTEDDLVHHALIPVLNSLEQIERWSATSDSFGKRLEAVLHFDTGMSRLGLPADETAQLAEQRWRLDQIDVVHVMSHLASADVPGSPGPRRQLELFRALRATFGMGTASLANSAAIFLSPDFHFDVARPGIALYGGNPTPGSPNPMRPVIELEAPILQLRNVAAGEAIGYGATHTMQHAGRVATIGVGYADGFLRSASNRGNVAIGGVSAPIIGRISMDLITIDVTHIRPDNLWVGAAVELIGSNCLIDDVADRAGSIANELLTDLGRRYQVTHLNL